MGWVTINGKHVLIEDSVGHVTGGGHAGTHDPAVETGNKVVDTATKMEKLNSNTYRVRTAVAHGIIHRAEKGWTSKVYQRGELYRDLGTFKTRRGAADEASHLLTFIK